MLESRARITNPTGLHARPAVKLAQLAARFRANVQVCVGEEGNWIKARSTAKVMKLKARANATLRFRAEGDEASEALAALIAFVERDFDEGSQPAEGQGQTPFSPPPSIPVSASGESRVLDAETASPGIARGVIHWLAPMDATVQRRKGNRTEERRALRAAVAMARRQLRDLSCRGDPMAADIMAFQLGLLDDEELLGPVLRAIGDGMAVEDAWCGVLDGEINDYTGTDDGYFRDRAADLRDLRDRVLAGLHGIETAAGNLPARTILVTDRLSPSSFLELDRDRVLGMVLREGSRTSHVAMLARGCGLPVLINPHGELADLPDGVEAIVDGDNGRLLLAPDASVKRQYDRRIREREVHARKLRSYLAQPGRTADGVRVRVLLNVDDPKLLHDVKPAYCDGIGLTRTELLFCRGGELPDEQTQYQAYCDLLDWAEGRPVTVRTLDVGGDKPIPGLTPEAEANPFLGVRGLRLSLIRPEVFRVQLRALARAAARGPLKVMVPMVTVPEELQQARQLLAQQVEALAAEGVAATLPTLGMMVEVPAAALRVADFQADFLSIGSNDLIQYVMAAGRDCAGVASLQDPLSPAVLELIERVVRQGHRAGIEVSVCGEMATQPKYLSVLIASGVRALSVPPAALGGVKAALSQCRTRDGD
jgi:phosphotransferase system enzyme I (PtsI)